MKLLEFLKQRKKIVIASIMAMAALAILLFNASQRDAGAGEEYETEAAQRGQVISAVSATGAVRAAQSVDLVWETSGIVGSVKIGLGASVHDEDVLAALRSSSLPENVILAESEWVSAQEALDDLLKSDEALAQAAIDLRDAEDNYDTYKERRDALDNMVDYEIFSGFETRDVSSPIGPMRVKVPKFKTIKIDPTEEDIAEADEALALALAQWEDAQRTYDELAAGNLGAIAAAEARIAAAQATLDQARITAPFDGVITDENVKVGDKVSPGDFAFRIDDLSSLLIDVNVSEVDINSVAVGQTATITFDAAQGVDYHGQVIEIAGAGASASGSVEFRVTVELTDADERVKPGMTAAVLIQVRNVEDGLLVPNRAMRVVDGKRLVYVLKDGVLTQVEIQLGAIAETYSEVADGQLQVGDLIVLNPPSDFSLSPSAENSH